MRDWTISETPPLAELQGKASTIIGPDVHRLSTPHGQATRYFGGRRQ